MLENENPTTATLEHQITKRYGLLLSQAQLAELLDHTVGGPRYSLSYHSDHRTQALKVCGRRI